jgi:tetratricopeptide (TPR) repeat protein
MAPPAGSRNAGDLYSRGFIGYQDSCYDLAGEPGGQAILIDRANPSYRPALGNALRVQGGIAGAVAQYQRAIVLRPDHPAADNNLGAVLNPRGKRDDAVARYMRSLELSRSYADLYNNRGVALMMQGQFVDALAQFNRALEVNPDHADAHCNLGTALATQGRSVEAATHLARALELNPRHADAHNSLGNICKDDARFDDAMAHYGRAIAIRPDHGEAHFNRSEIKFFHRDDAELAALEALARRDDLPVRTAIHVHFALAKALEDAGDYDRSFEHLRVGNTLKRGQVGYDEIRGIGLLRRIAAVFDCALLDRFQGEGDPSTVPVFVLGMPRSGSTLIEQILAGHPRIHCAGELPDFEAAASSVLRGSDLYPECVPALDGATLRRIGKSYLDRLPALVDGKIRIVDKLPGNFLNIGLIRLFLPNARIIHTMRRPIDTCVSCYSKLFTSGHHYTYDLGELGRFYRGYSELMDHWRSVLPPGAMLDVSYEDVVDDLEGQARRFIDYCGLPWDDRCLSFYNNCRPVRTASAIQVRQPLFRSSLERWRKYERGIGPLLEELEKLVPG